MIAAISQFEKRFEPARRARLLPLALALACAIACKDTTKISLEKASSHVGFLVETIKKDVEEVRSGLPAGAAALGAAWKADAAIGSDAKATQRALENARRTVQDLRVAKSTFFALADVNGVVIRNDQEQDRMAGHGLFESFPALAGAKSGYLETAGSMPEAAGVRAPRPDGQWVAGAPVSVDGAPKGLYVTGWSWSSYAYHLEFALRSRIKSELMGNAGAKEPLLYVYMVVGKSVYGAPVSPEVNMKAIADVDPLSHTTGDAVFSRALDVTGRSFGLAVRRAPALGPDVGVAVLRSET